MYTAHAELTSMILLLSLLMFNQLCARNQNRHGKIITLAGISSLIISEEPMLFIHINGHSIGK